MKDSRIRIRTHEFVINTGIYTGVELNFDTATMQWSSNILYTTAHVPFATLKTKMKLGRVSFCKDFWDRYWHAPSGYH